MSFSVLDASLPMNSPSPSASQPVANRRFILDLLGFSDGETSMLASTFRLTGRRAFSYALPTGPEDRPDIYLVNSDSPDGLAALAARAPNVHAPAVLIGGQPVALAWPQVARPIQWMRLFEQLDQQMRATLRERSRRPAETDSAWDGRTYRRAADKGAPSADLAASAKALESVLVVDDSATVRAFMRAKLAPFGFDIDYAESGEIAIEMAQSKRYTCVFLDILMPGIDGYEVCKRLKSYALTKNTAVVMLSSKSSVFDKFRGNWAGCDAYLGKPVDENDLLSTIARFLPSARGVAHAILTSTA